MYSRSLIFLLCMFVSLISEGQITFVSSGGGTTTGSSVVTTTTTIGATFIGITVQYYPNSTNTNIPSIADNQSNTWRRAKMVATTSNQGTVIWYCYNCTVNASHTFTVTSASGAANVSIGSFTGVLTTADPLTDSNGATSGVTSVGSIAPGSITPTRDSSLVLAGFMTSSSTPQVSAPTGYTLISRSVGGTVSGGIGAYQIQTSRTATNPSITLSPNNGASSCIAAFRAAPTASTINSQFLMFMYR